MKELATAWIMPKETMAVIEKFREVEIPSIEPEYKTLVPISRTSETLQETSLPEMTAAVSVVYQKISYESES